MCFGGWVTLVLNTSLVLLYLEMLKAEKEDFNKRIKISCWVVGCVQPGKTHQAKLCVPIMQAK